MFSKPYLPAVGWAALILILTLLPPQALPKVPDWNIISIHSLAHLFVFMVWAFLVLDGFTKSSAGSGLRTSQIFLTLFLAISYGIIIELLQGFMRLGRQPDIVDVVYNTVGALLGILFFYLVKVYKRTS
ncbi:VanZ family protein [Adhaeribacter radiodurans]|uniref:VanZ family protein n=1 Tax=Adhaeribacter radiodurans TaxID=2745197 RepID=A0A7L7LBN6_9BACT|nr:VanZ family protein [Adhaeribacter radiodurans]QMU30183.1 VanZ family protein [Adhaeribacter radiodurans]